MGIFKLAKGTAKSFVNVKGWISYDMLKEQSKGLFRSVRLLFKIQKPTYKETFEEAFSRLGLTKEDLVQQISHYQKMMWFYLSIGILLVLYAFWLLWQKHFLSGLLALAISSLPFIFACAMNFYNFQIKQRKLGCTLTEWLSGQIEEQRT